MGGPAENVRPNGSEIPLENGEKAISPKVLTSTPPFNFRRYMNLERMLFKAVIVLSIGLLGYMVLSIYNIRVIDQQRDLIKQLYHDNCGGTRGQA